MSLSIEKRQELIVALLKEIKQQSPLAALTISQRFGISKQTVYKHLAMLVTEGRVIVSRQGRSNHYALKVTTHSFQLPISGLEEDVVWREMVRPLLQDLPENVMTACSHGFTEILNNAIDHSDAQEVTITVTQDAVSVEFMIRDFGIGIFTKIQKALGLDDPKHSIFELAKGKLTTDPTKHSGEGIFFTSRIFDLFYIRSCELEFLSGRDKGPDYLYEDLDKNENKGTCVIMRINKDSDVVTREVFAEFTAASDDSFGFTKTHIPVRLAKYEGEMLVSRSQAKRLIRRFERFIEVVLDFKDVMEIGQAFADELFRVFKLEHPEVELIPINMSDEVKKMVFRALSKQ